jgi:hypothetical protein
MLFKMFPKNQIDYSLTLIGAIAVQNQKAALRLRSELQISYYTFVSSIFIGRNSKLTQNES